MAVFATATRADDAGAGELPRVRIEARRMKPADPYGATRATSATKTDTLLRDVPQSVTVVTEELIADQAMHGMADVVRYVPGITMGQGEGNRDQPTVRGNATTADFFVDGVRDDVQYFRDLYNLERVEALKGSNAMIFGRGGGGGVINRVTKQADWHPHRSFSLQASSYDSFRGTLDVGQAVSDAFTARLNAMYEESDSFRDEVHLDRYGINPTLAFAFGERTSIRLGYEHFSDGRVADRGIPSFAGRPVRTDASTFFGDPDLSHSDARVDVVSAHIEHETAGGLTIRNHTRYADYGKFYRNVFPGAVDATGTQVRISAYDNATGRENLFNQTDLVWSLEGAGLRHTLLVGAELGRQKTDSFRRTGYFNDAATFYTAPLASPRISVPVTFRQSASDADNHVEADVAAVYVQDQVELSAHLQAVVGLRFDRFDLSYRNNRDGAELARKDELVSPRAGLIYKPAEPVSIYASYSVSYLPSSGDQFASLTATTQALEPEEFANYEIGVKWDLREDLALTAAAYRLDRSNTSAPDPGDPTRIVQTGSQRTRGVELVVSGALAPRWRVMGGYAWQQAGITSRTTAALPGATVPLTPKHTLSLWNRFDLTPRWGFGLGVVYQDEVYTAIDNSVTLPSFTRVDAAAFLRVSERLSAQLNVENLLDERYYPTAHSNNNITPGSPPALRLTLNSRF